MPEGSYKLVEFGVYSRTTDQFDSGLGLASLRHALVDLQFRLANKGVEEVMECIFADGPQFMGVLWVP